ncbi:MAG: UDP-N-acetylmuramoyl-tripeptide--D-alanyl-D-alanine ligase [Candidatus Omnitrophica bacterium]|nr:UDP-N-acetylmuramoyl-tripeptide--D-alanyl-D-alanine ligase [Candidatus Omnitrophota bacterium]
MIELTAKDVSKVIDGGIISDDPGAQVSGFSVDTRTLVPGEFFIAIKGKNFDGHDFIEEAVNKGASGIIAEKPRYKSKISNGARPVTNFREIYNGPRAAEYAKGRAPHTLLVEDTSLAMGKIAGEIRRRVNLPVICITGTNGKTTVKRILSRILSSKFKVLESRRSYNNIIGVSLTLFDLDPSYDLAVLELGTNYPGEIASLAGIARPDIAVMTNIGNGHLEFLSDRESVFAEKTRILDYLPDEGAAFLNKDDEFLAGTSIKHGHLKFYGMHPGSDFLISDLFMKEGGQEFSLGGESFFIPLEGAHNVYNAAAAISVALHLGMKSEEIRSALCDVSLPEMRLEKVIIDDLVFINDSYNANPDSFQCALEVLKGSREGSSKIVVAGDMTELGTLSDDFHRRLGRSIAEKSVDFLIVLGENAEKIIDGALTSGMEKEKVLHAKSHSEAAEMVKKVSPPEAVVLIKGSRKSRMEEVLKCFTISCTH